LICYILSINYTYSQNYNFSPENIRYYKLSELDTAHIDSVRAVNLSKLKLSELPKTLYRFHNIEYLDLSKNKLERIDSLSIFVNLRYLNLGKNKLSIFPVSICSLSNLRWLSLQSNSIASIPSCIQYCEQLEYVDLWGCLVSYLPDEMAYISSLKEIDLSAIQLNQYQQDQIRDQFPQVRLKMGAACNCGF